MLVCMLSLVRTKTSSDEALIFVKSFNPADRTNPHGCIPSSWMGVSIADEIVEAVDGVVGGAQLTWMSSGVGVLAGVMLLGYRVPSLLTSRDGGAELAGV